jgi:hypothetical protein
MKGLLIIFEIFLTKRFINIILNKFSRIDLNFKKDVRLIHYWPFDGNVKDLIGNADLYNGENSNFILDRLNRPNKVLSLTSGRYSVPTGVYFDGSDFTLMNWIRIKQQISFARIFEVANGPNVDAIVFCISSSGQPVLTFSSGTSSTLFLTSSKYLTTNKWYHLTFSYKQPTSKLYIDGVLADTLDTSVLEPIRKLNRSSNWVGRSNWYPNWWQYDAMHDLDDIKIFNGELNIEDILFEMNNNI